MHTSTEGLRQRKPVLAQIADGNVGKAHVLECKQAPESDGCNAQYPDTRRARTAQQGRHKSNRMSGRAYRIKQQWREIVFDVLRHGQQALLGHGQGLRIAAGFIPAHQRGLGFARVGVPAPAARALTTMNRNVDEAALPMQTMPGLIDDSEHLVPRGDLVPFQPRLRIRAAQGGAANSQQYLTGRGRWRWHDNQANVPITGEVAGFHDGLM